MERNKLWRWVFPALALVLWAATVGLLVFSGSTCDSGDPCAWQAVEAAGRWLPACCIGAVPATAAACVAEDPGRLGKK